MKKLFLSLSFFGLAFFKLSAQTAPYALSPKWVFGNNAFFDFTTGSPAQPAISSGIAGAEGTSTLCDSLKNVAICTDNFNVAGGNYVSVGTMTSSRSSTDGGVIIPNPANPYGSFFIAAGNAEVAGGSETAGAGTRLYRATKSGSTLTGLTQISILETNANGIKENVYAGVTDDWGYWVVAAKAPSGANQFNAWEINSAGALSGPVTSNGGTQWNPQYQGTIKINRCQDRIALVWGSIIEVREWNRSTGTVGAQLYYSSDAPPSKYYGCEFSPNGNYLYVTTLSPSPVKVIDLTASPATRNDMAGGNATGTLQLGPNGVIYLSNGSDATPTTNIGTITSPNTGGTYNPSGVTLANGSQKYLGMSNIAWLNPRKPSIIWSLSSCTYTLTPQFLTYFKDVITIDRAEWDFGDGTADVINTGGAADDPVTHNFSSIGNKTITLTVRDATCGHSFTNTYVLNVTCALPVELISFTGIAENGNVRLNWSTATETNNDYFIVERSSDGINFTAMDTIDGKGNSHVISNYDFLDENAEETNYYRLVQRDFDGKTATSSVILVKLNGLQLVVYPTPTSNEFNVKVANADEGTITVYNLLGAEVFTTQTSGSAIQFTFGSDLAKGYYTLKYTSGAESKTYKLEKF